MLQSYVALHNLFILHACRRDSCDEVLAKTGEEPYLTCLNLLQPILLGNPDATEEEVHDYCTSPKGCPTVIRYLLGNITEACQGGEVSVYLYV